MAQLSREPPDDNTRELMLLSSCFRASVSRGDRNKGESRLGSDVDPFTGLVKSEASLLPEGEALVGPSYAKARWIQPEECALLHLMRQEHDGTVVMLLNARAWAVVTDQPDLEHPGTTNEIQVALKPIHELGVAEEEVLYLRRTQPSWNARIVERRGRSALTAEEARDVSFLKHAFEKTLYSFAERGWVSLNPPEFYKSPAPEGARGGDAQFQRGVSDRGEIFCASWTNDGFDAATRICSGDPRWGQVGAFSSLEGQTAEIKAAAAVASPWAHKKFLQEGGRA